MCPLCSRSWEYTGAVFPEATHNGFEIPGCRRSVQGDVVDLLASGNNIDGSIWKRIAERTDTRKSGNIDPAIRRAFETVFEKPLKLKISCEYCCAHGRNTDGLSLSFYFR